MNKIDEFFIMDKINEEFKYKFLSITKLHLSELIELFMIII